MTPEAQRLIRYIEIIEAELHENQRRQQALIVSLQRARAELQALDGGIVVFDGEVLCRG